MRTRHSGRTSPLVFEPEIERVARRNRQHRLEEPIPSNSQSPPIIQPLSFETVQMASSNPNRRSGESRRPPTPPHPNQNQQNPPHQPIHNRNPNTRNVNQGPSMSNRGNPTFDPVNRYNEAGYDDYVENIEELRANINDDDPFSVPSYQSSDRVSVHSYHSGEDEYSERDYNEDDEDWGYRNVSDDYGDEEEYHGDNSSNVGANRNGGNDGYYNHVVNNHQPRQNPRRHQFPNIHQNRGENFVGRAERRPNGGRQPRGEEVNAPRRRPPVPMQGVNGRFRPLASENESPIVPPPPGRRSFDCKPNYINILPHFHGMANEDPYDHLSEFKAMCGKIGR